MPEDFEGAILGANVGGGVDGSFGGSVGGSVDGSPAILSTGGIAPEEELIAVLLPN